jgi:hypothetical protein
MHGSSLTSKEQGLMDSLSDHQAVLWKLSLSTATKQPPLTIPDRKLALEITTQILRNPKIQNSTDFLKELRALRQANGTITKDISRPKKPQSSKILEILRSLDGSSNVTQVINDYWSNYWKELELLRFSSESQQAYSDLKKILRYHLFEKRDGAIISSIIDSDGSLISDPQEVAKHLLQTLEEIQVDPNFPFIPKKSFPILPPLSKEELGGLMSMLSTNKAIAYDAAHDVMFKPSEDKHSLFQAASSILTDLWSIPLDEFLTEEDTWATRLMALNKVFPDTPNRKQFRAICIQSAIVKLLEARFLPKLQEYLIARAVPSQTGFIPTMGTQVNLRRAINRIKLRTDQKHHIYGLFVDFSNAYNTVPHHLLFQKLRAKAILAEDEVSFIEQLYARYVVKSGNMSLKSNKGVAQGSVISPALFNIFIEDLATKLTEEAGVDPLDILMYADDILVLCTSQPQMETAIRTIKEWSKANGMSLNAKKSGIVPFAPRRAKKIPLMTTETTFITNKKGKEVKITSWIAETEEILDIPVCTQYKYLGSYLSNKLTADAQLSFIDRKAGHLFTRLFPYLQSVSSDARRDAFLTFINPLFAATSILMEAEQSKSKYNQVVLLRKKWFKKFLRISKTTSTWLMDQMLGRDFNEVINHDATVADLKWTARMQGQTCTAPKLMNGPNLLRGVPLEWSTLVNTIKRPCPVCKNPRPVLSRWHMLIRHQIKLPAIEHIWNTEIISVTRDPYKTIQTYSGKTKEIKMQRREVSNLLSPIIQGHLNNFLKAYSSLSRS